MKRCKKVLAMVLSLVMVLGLTVPVMAANMKGKIVVLHTNDIHGYYQTTDTSIGIAGVAALKDYYTSQGAEVILLDAGDFSQGQTLVNHEKGLKATEYLVEAGYDAVSLGNHEFDFGFDALLDMAAVLKAGGVKILDENILKKGTTETYFEGSMVMEKGGVKIGIVGLDTAETQTKSSPSSVKDVTFLDGEDMFKATQAKVDALKAEGCTYIIALTHLGVDDESTGRRSIDVANVVKGLDLIIDGHSHTVMDGGQKIGDTLVTSTGSYLANVGVVMIDAKTLETQASLISAETFAADYGMYDESLTAMVAADKAEVDAHYSGVFATTMVDLNGERDPGVRTMETNLGDFSADAYLYLGKKYAQEEGLGISVDVALSNGGGIRASIPKGEISMNTLYTVFPYGNTVTLVTITGAQLLEVIEASTFSTPTALGGFPQIAGAEYTLDTSVEYVNGTQYPDSTYFAPANPGSRVTITSVGGKAFDLQANYTVVVNSFQAEGGDTYYALTQGSFIQDTGIIDAEALIQYVNSKDGVIGTEYAQPQGRITMVSDETTQAPTEAPTTGGEGASAETPKPTTTQEAVMSVYKVVAGDSLWKIAKNQLGSGSLWTTIYEDNKSQISDPSRIRIGQELKIRQKAK